MRLEGEVKVLLPCGVSSPIDGPPSGHRLRAELPLTGLGASLSIRSGDRLAGRHVRCSAGRARPTVNGLQGHWIPEGAGSYACMTTTSDATRQRIFGAAEAVFADKGYPVIRRLLAGRLAHGMRAG